MPNSNYSVPLTKFNPNFGAFSAFSGLYALLQNHGVTGSDNPQLQEFLDFINEDMLMKVAPEARPITPQIFQKLLDNPGVGQALVSVFLFYYFNDWVTKNALEKIGFRVYETLNETVSAAVINTFAEYLFTGKIPVTIPESQTSSRSLSFYRKSLLMPTTLAIFPELPQPNDHDDLTSADLHRAILATFYDQANFEDLGLFQGLLEDSVDDRVKSDEDEESMRSSSEEDHASTSSLNFSMDSVLKADGSGSFKDHCMEANGLREYISPLLYYLFTENDKDIDEKLADLNEQQWIRNLKQLTIPEKKAFQAFIDVLNNVPLTAEHIGQAQIWLEKVLRPAFFLVKHARKSQHIDSSIEMDYWFTHAFIDFFVKKLTSSSSQEKANSSLYASFYVLLCSYLPKPTVSELRAKIESTYLTSYIAEILTHELAIISGEDALSHNKSKLMLYINNLDKIDQDPNKEILLLFFYKNIPTEHFREFVQENPFSDDPTKGTAIYKLHFANQNNSRKKHSVSASPPPAAAPTSPSMSVASASSTHHHAPISPRSISDATSPKLQAVGTRIANASAASLSLTAFSLSRSVTTRSAPPSPERKGTTSESPLSHLELSSFHKLAR